MSRRKNKINNIIQKPKKYEYKKQKKDSFSDLYKKGYKRGKTKTISQVKTNNSMCINNANMQHLTKKH